MRLLSIHNVGQIKEANIRFADLTVLVGPQACGKSITLQWIKLLLDAKQIRDQWMEHGLETGGDLNEFLDLYFGEGMHTSWTPDSRVLVDNRLIQNPTTLTGRNQNHESVIIVPAHRVISFTDGWPRNFLSYSSSDPYMVRAFSEKLRRHFEIGKENTKENHLFPNPDRLRQEHREQLQATVFGEFTLKIDKVRSQKRLVLEGEATRLPYMAWSAGQRELVPLLLTLSWLLPAGGTTRRDELEWVIIEEPEMGLHPRAITSVLLIILELLFRGYKVILSTHSPQILELIWAMETIRKQRGNIQALFKLFSIQNPSQNMQTMINGIAEKKSSVYCYQKTDEGFVTQEITNWNADASSTMESSWGGLLHFSDLANEIVADVMANS
ncbi:MAG: ATP-binding protein [Magnetococcales bacterium]|nr:ATP-binding protein [Magnetococcales bacterium]